MSTMVPDKPKRRPRRKFTDEFKQQAARLVIDEGKSMAEVARELDLVPTALRDWVDRARADHSKGKTGLTTVEREELSRLRRQVRVLEEEREILKKGSCLAGDTRAVDESGSVAGRESPGRRSAFTGASSPEKKGPECRREAPRIVALAGR